MKFTGRITKVMPSKSGTSKAGNKWVKIPIEFSFYETDDSTWESRIVLDIFSTETIKEIANYCEKGNDGKVIYENGKAKYLPGIFGIPCSCVFSLNTKEYTNQEGQQITINDVRCVRLDIEIPQKQESQPAQAAQQSVTNAAPSDEQPADDPDDLPF